MLEINIQKKLLLNLTKKCVFSVNNKLIKQVDGCPMRDTIPVAFSDIYVSKMDEDIVAPMKLHFCKRYVDDTCIRKKNNKNTCSYWKAKFLSSEQKINH